MSKFHYGELVFATLPNGDPSKHIYVVASDEKMTTCVYLNSEREPISVALPTDWLSVPPKPKPRRGSTIDVIG